MRAGHAEEGVGMLYSIDALSAVFIFVPHALLGMLMAIS